MGEGEPRRARGLPGGGRAAGARRRTSRGEGRGAVPDVRAREERPPTAGLRRSPAAHHGCVGGTPECGRGVPRAVPLLRGRRVPGRHPGTAAAAGRVARRPGRRHRGRRRQPDHLLVRRCLAPAAARLHPPVSGRHRGPARTGLPVEPPGRVPGQPGDRCGQGQARRLPADARRAAAGRAGTGVLRTPRRGGRGGRRRGEGRRADRGGYGRGGGRGAVPRQRAVRGLREGAVRARCPVRGARR